VRLLGAWIGNNIENLTPWEVIIHLIKKDLQCWGRIHPTIYGKHIITQAIIGGCTQYFAKVQGMPPHIEDAIQKIIQEFIWDGENTPQISMNTLHCPLHEGGLNLLNIRACNKAICYVYHRRLPDLGMRGTQGYFYDLL
jgi:hypothetical protein